MDAEINCYELDMAPLMAELARQLESHGYIVSEPSPGRVWRFETRWSRGAAYGEIGSLMYGLVANRLKPIDDESEFG
jgi:hypothetical protein